MAEARISYAPTDELELIQSTAAEFLADRFGTATVRELMMSDDGFDSAAWKEIVELGWTGLAIAEEHGGSGYGMIEMSALLEVMGRHVVPGPFFASAVLATTAVQEAGTAEQQANLLPRLASGEIGTLAVFERARDWSLSKVETTATRDAEVWVLNGVKRYVLDGHLADLLVVAADQGLFVVESGADGVRIEQTPTLDATRRQATVSLEGVRVPSGSLLGDRGLDSLSRTLLLGTTALAAEQYGGITWCLDTSVEHAKTRHQFGRPIGSFQAIKHRCAEMLIKSEHSKSAAYHAARVTDDPDELAIAAPLAGSICSDGYVWAAGETIQILGGIGFTWEHDAHLYFKRAKASSLLLGDPRHHRRLLGDAIGI
ncbi:MAG: acyl-CoA dehydrogenase family protein [Acidimicrobiia bacterium]|nr:acyl-CoA dehydrogenase family protein [Acidimicrobiia bacterium]